MSQRPCISDNYEIIIFLLAFNFALEYTVQKLKESKKELILIGLNHLFVYIGDRNCFNRPEPKLPNGLK